MATKKVTEEVVDPVINEAENSVKMDENKPKKVEKRLNLHERIIKIMEMVAVIKKEGKVEFKNTKYNYQREEDVTAAVREALLKYGITIIPVQFRVEKVEAGLTTVAIQYKVTDAETGECEYLTMGGQGQDSGDKGIYKAETGAFKYLQKQMLWLGSQESDPDDIPSDALNQPAPPAVKEEIQSADYLDTVFKNGKHKGQTIKAVAESDKGYILWMAGKQGDMQAVCQKAVEDLKLNA